MGNRDEGSNPSFPSNKLIHLKETVMERIEKLKELVESINAELKVKIPEINRGGCGVFALRMHNELKKVGYNPKIVIIDNSISSFNNRKNTLNNLINGNRRGIDRWDKRDTSFAHCCIEVDGILFDGITIGDKLKEDWKRYTFSGEYTPQEMKLALRVGGWNSVYSRRKNPIMYRAISKSIKQTFKVV